MKNDKIITKDEKSGEFKYKVYLPANYKEEKKSPLFIVLHGDGSGGNIEEFSTQWQPNTLLNKGFIVIYIQSSQMLYHNNYGWLKNPLKTRKDIKDWYELVSKEYSVDEESILIGGFSGGSIAAMDITLANVIPIKGFISLCPVLKPNAFNIENVDNLSKRGVRGVIMEGETELPVLNEEEMMKAFDNLGVKYKYYINKGIGHSFPKDFNYKLIEGIEFILE